MSIGILSGVSLVFTGRMKQERRLMEADAHRLGGYSEDRVTQRTNWLVVGKRPGQTKLRAAEQRGTKVLSEADYEQELARRKAEAAAAIAAAEAVPPEMAAPRVPAPDWAKQIRTSKSLRF